MRHVLLSGPSLGGALSVIAGAFLGLALGPASKVDVATFGCPRPGTAAFRDLFHECTSSAWRIVHQGDPIPKTPPRTPVHSSEHVGLEVLVDPTGDMVLDPIALEHDLLHSCRGGSPLVEHARVAYLRALLVFALGLYHNNADASALERDLAGPASNPGAFFPVLWGNVAYFLTVEFRHLLAASGASEATPNAKTAKTEALRILQLFMVHQPVPPAVAEREAAFEAARVRKGRGDMYEPAHAQPLPVLGDKSEPGSAAEGEPGTAAESEPRPPEPLGRDGDAEAHLVAELI